MNRDLDEYRQRLTDALVRGVSVVVVLAAVLTLMLAAVTCEAHTTEPVPRLAYPVNNFAECAPCIAYHFSALGHDCAAVFVDKHPRHIAGHVNGVAFAVTTAAWRSFPEMNAHPIIWMIDEQIVVESVLAGAFE